MSATLVIEMGLQDNAVLATFKINGKTHKKLVVLRPESDPTSAISRIQGWARKITEDGRKAD